MSGTAKHHYVGLEETKLGPTAFVMAASILRQPILYAGGRVSVVQMRL